MPPHPPLYMRTSSPQAWGLRATFCTHPNTWIKAEYSHGMQSSQIPKHKHQGLRKLGLTYTTHNCALDYHASLSYINLHYPPLYKRRENPCLSNPFLTISQSTCLPVANETHGAGPSGNAQLLNKGCVHAALQFPDEATSAAQPMNFVTCLILFWETPAFSPFTDISQKSNFVFCFFCYFWFWWSKTDLGVLQIVEVSGIYLLFETGIWTRNLCIPPAVGTTASTAMIWYRKIKICSTQMCITFHDAYLRTTHSLISCLAYPMC